ncbi:MAG: DNA-processing protein DprA, partial [Acidobacteriota bacterium]
ITARMAAEQGRDVYAVPGNITSQTSFGPNYLIKDGAKLIQCARDVLEELPTDLRQRLLGLPAHPDQGVQTNIDSVILTPAEQIVIDLLSADAPAHIDQLLLASQLSSPEMMNALLGLEMKDRIIQLPGKSFLRRL